MLIPLLHRRRKAVAEAMKTVKSGTASVAETKRVYGFRLVVAGLMWASIYLLSRGLLELQLPGQSVRVLVALMPVPFFLWFLWRWMEGVARIDELERRIELEALAFAFPICVVLLMTLGLLEIAVPLNPDDWSYRDVWAMMPALYYAGLWRARRRYQ